MAENPNMDENNGEEEKTREEIVKEWADARSNEETKAYFNDINKGVQDLLGHEDAPPEIFMTAVVASVMGGRDHIEVLSIMREAVAICCFLGQINMDIDADETLLDIMELAREAYQARINQHMEGFILSMVPPEGTA